MGRQVLCQKWDMTRDLRRRPRTYPLPRRGVSSTELNSRISRRDLRHAVYNNALVPIARGLYSPLADAGEHQRHVDALQALTTGTGRVVSHATAAILLELLHMPLEPPFHITTPRKGPRVLRTMVTGHRSDIPSTHIVQRLGISVTSPAWTWTDLAINGSLIEALVLADRFIRPGRREFGEASDPPTSIDQLRKALSLRGRANGVRAAARALELARTGVDSPQETRLRFYMNQAGLPEPEVNGWLLDNSGRRVVQPDLLLRRWRVAIQYDGEKYHSGEQMRKDVLRTERTEALGWKEVRITKDHMHDSGRLAIAKIERELLARGWRR